MLSSSNSMDGATYFTRNGNEIRVVKDSKTILIEIDHFQNSKVYGMTLTPEDVATLDPLLFSNLEDLHFGIITALKGKDSSITARVDENMNIHFSWIGMVGNAQRTRQFVIELKEKNLNLLERGERDAAKLHEQTSHAFGYVEMHFLRMMENVMGHLRKKEGQVEVGGQVIGLESFNAAFENVVKRVGKMEEDNGTFKRNIEQRMEQSEKKMVDMVGKVEEEVKKLNQKVREVEDSMKGRVEKVEASVREVGELKKLIETTNANTKTQLDKSVEEVKEELKKLTKSVEDKAREQVKSVEDLNGLKERVSHVEASFKEVGELKKLVETTNDTTKKQLNKSVQDLNKMVEGVREQLRKLEDNYKSINERVQAKNGEKRDSEQGAESQIQALTLMLDEFSKRFKTVEDQNQQIKTSVETLRSQQKDNYNELLLHINSQSEDLGTVKGEYNKIKDQVKTLSAAVSNATILQHIRPEFKADYVDCLNYKDSNREIESKGGRTVNQALFCEKAVPKKGKYSFSIKVTDVTRKAGSILAVGVAKMKLRETGNILDSGCYFINPFDKIVYLNGKMADHDGKAVNPYDVVNLVIDRDSNLIYFKINDEVCFEEKLDMNSFGDEELHPCVYCENCTDLKLSFV